MVKVRPFKAIRPTRDKAHLFATRSYLTYSKETLKEKNLLTKNLAKEVILKKIIIMHQNKENIVLTIKN